MRIVKINDKEQMMKVTVGVLNRTSRQLKIKTPEIFTGFDNGDLEVAATLLFHSIAYSDKKFEMESINELSIDEYAKLRVELLDEMTKSIPDATAGEESTGKK